MHRGLLAPIPVGAAGRAPGTPRGTPSPLQRRKCKRHVRLVQQGRREKAHGIVETRTFFRKGKEVGQDKGRARAGLAQLIEEGVRQGLQHL